VTDEGVARLEERPRQPALGGELPHQQEQRHHREVVDREARVGACLEETEQRRDAGHHDVAERASEQHRDADVHAKREQQQQHAEHQDAPFDAGHARSFRRLACAW
jgi:hypothetical protein